MELFYIAPMGYGDININELCANTTDVDLRSNCTSEMECFIVGGKLCGPDPNCFGIAWYDEDYLSQPLKLCRSAVLQPMPGWHTVMKQGMYKICL